MFIRKWMGTRWLSFRMEGHDHRFMWNMDRELIVKLPATLPDEQTYLVLEFVRDGLEGAVVSAERWLVGLDAGISQHEECDACGELKLFVDGELDTGGPIRPDQIDPPEETWICADCVARYEEMEISRAEQAVEDQYYYEK